MGKSTVLASSIAIAAGQQAGTLQAENHPAMTWSDHGETKNGMVVIDANWRWTHKTGETTNCYTDNEWDAQLCPDKETCTQNCVVEGADKEYEATYGVQTWGSKLTLGFVTEGEYSVNVGSRTFLMDDDYAYKLFQLKNKEFTYTVDDSNLDCGLNGALYFVQMDADGGKSKYGNAGAQLGLGYGEANVEGWVPSDTDKNAGTGKYGSCCTEIDIWEANKMATAYTMHSCSPGEQTRCDGVDCGDNGEDRFSGLCDKNGCDIQPHRLGTHDFFGPGSDFQIDSTKPVTVTTQFITNDGSDHGKLVEVKQIYQQDGRTIEHPSYTVNGKQHQTITDDFCADWVAVTQDGTNFLEKGGLDAVEKAIDAGVVLVMSLWDDHYANMLWLASTYPVGCSDPGAYRGACSADSGVPADVEVDQAKSHVKFSDIKFGPIGSTLASAVAV